jgi:hypothetical protein
MPLRVTVDPILAFVSAPASATGQMLMSITTIVVAINAQLLRRVDLSVE